jgi:hypothetical protein
MKLHNDILPLLASIRAGLFEQQETDPAHAAAAPPPSFVTVSRQAGAGGRSFARNLVERLNKLHPGQRPWTAWDRELVERVVAEHHIPESLVEQVESYHRSTFGDRLTALFASAGDQQPDEVQVYRRIAQTVRALARAGRAVIVGRGGVYATDDLPGGVHVRLVAPLESRVANMARVLKVSEDRAAAEVRRLDHDRDTFHRRYWSGKALLAEVFTITLNTARTSEEQLVDCVLPLILRVPPVRALATHKPSGEVEADRTDAAAVG